jgi:propionyl-CoA carboxylase alpha chain
VAPTTGGHDIAVEGKNYAIRSAWQPGNPLLRCDLNGKPACLQIQRLALGYRLSHGGSQADIKVLTPYAAELDALMPVKEPPDLSKYLLSPMPGLLVSVAVAAGQEVRAGEELAVVEAMKMENILRAERDGIVAAVHAKSGDSLAVDQKILEFE